MGDGLGFLEVCGPVSGTVTIWKIILADYKEYPEILRLTSGATPRPTACLARQVLQRSSGMRIRSSGSTCRSAGHLTGQTNSSGTSGTLVGGDPWVPMSLNFSRLVGMIFVSPFNFTFSGSFDQ